MTRGPFAQSRRLAAGACHTGRRPSRLLLRVHRRQHLRRRHRQFVHPHADRAAGSRWRSPPSAGRCSPRRRPSPRTDAPGSAPPPGSARSSAGRTPPGSGSRGTRRYPAGPWRCRCTPRSTPSRCPAPRRPGSGLPRRTGGSPCRRPAPRRSAGSAPARSPDRLPRRRTGWRSPGPGRRHSPSSAPRSARRSPPPSPPVPSATAA